MIAHFYVKTFNWLTVSHFAPCNACVYGLQPALGTATKVNATIHFEGNMRGGAPLALASSYQYDVDGIPHQFQLYPEVLDVSPSIGSNAGGTLLRITGRGFPELNLGLGDTITVSIFGVPCAIVNSTYGTVFCITGTKPTSTVSAVGSFYPGMRGIEYEFYNVSRSVAFADLWRLNKSITVENTGQGSYRTVITGNWEGNDLGKASYCSRSRAFFTAPRAGNYR